MRIIKGITFVDKDKYADEMHIKERFKILLCKVWVES